MRDVKDGSGSLGTAEMATALAELGVKQEVFAPTDAQHSQNFESSAISGSKTGRKWTNENPALNVNFSILDPVLGSILDPVLGCVLDLFWGQFCTLFWVPNLHTNSKYIPIGPLSMPGWLLVCTDAAPGLSAQHHW